MWMYICTCIYTNQYKSTDMVHTCTNLNEHIESTYIIHTCTWTQYVHNTCTHVHELT